MSVPKSHSSVFTKPFDGVDVPLVFVDMVLWVGAEEALRILRLSPHILSSLCDSEKKILKHLEPCSDDHKLFITALGVGLIANKLVNRGCIDGDNNISGENHLPERVNAFANIFLTDVISELRISCLLCGISKKEDAILDLLNVSAVA